MERVGSYEIVRVIARGGMATVYEARQPALDRSVALKRLDLRGEDAALAERFIRESRIAASFDHPNIVTVFDFFEWEGTPYIAMELLPRGSLRPWIGRLTLPQAFGVLEGVLAGLAHAEARGVAHRDLKPENVLVTHDGAVKIADFGIAKAYTEAAAGLTTTGAPVGTAAYMAPEQATGRPVGPRTDLYALGAMAYELFSGRQPFAADSLATVLYRQVNEPAPPLPAVDERVAAWVAWLLEKSPDARPPGAATAWHELEDVVVDLLGPYWRRHAPLRGPTPPPPPSSTPVGTTSGAAPGDDATAVVPSGGRRRWRALAAGVAAVLVAAVVVVLVATSGGSPPAAGPPAGRHGAAPYDFDGDGRPDVVAGLPSWPGGGAVALPGTDTVLTADELGIRGGRLGAALASADFDGDGHADLAVGVPGRDEVVVLNGSASGLAARLARTYRGPGYGRALAAADLDGDGRADLAIAATGSLRVLTGGPRGLGAPRVRQPSPAGDLRLLATGDVDGDRRPDLVAAGADGVAVCPGSGGACRTLPASGVTTLAVGDFIADGFADVIAGAPARNALEVWRGGRGGVARAPVTITQDSRDVPGHDQPGDDFGAALAVADVNGDGTLDLLVGAPGEDDGAGRVTMVGGRPVGGGIAYGQDLADVPGRKRAGHRLGAALSASGAPGATRLTVAAPGDRRALVTLALRKNGLPGPGSRALAIAGATAASRAGMRVGG